jgi:replicative DNA helicase
MGRDTMPELHRSPQRDQSIASEEALLGALLYDQTAWPRIAGTITASDLTRADHRSIFEAIGKLSAAGKAADAVTVADYLERQGVSDPALLADLATLARNTPSAANIETYAAAVRERASLRALEQLAGDIGRALQARGQSAAELVAKVQERLQRLQGRARTGKGLRDSRELLTELIDDLDRRSAAVQGLSLGLPDLDALTSGLEAGDLVVIAARPGMGKTALLVSIANTVSTAVPVAVFSAEMPAQQLMRRSLALAGSIPQGLLRRAERLTPEHWAAISAASATLTEQRIWIDETSSPALAHIRAECIAFNAKTALGLIVVDYAQLVVGTGANRYEQLRDVAYGLKALAKDLRVPIIVLAQLNRGVESREHKRPHLSDLRDSGAIEEAADIVGLLYQESYYDPNFGMPYVLECQVAKNRNGERGECLWRFEGAFSRITPLDDGARSQYIAQRAKARRKGAGNDL